MSTVAANSELLKVAGLNAGYGRRPVLHDIGFSIAAGEIAAIIGPNGSGKSTLLKALLGLNTFYSGSIPFDCAEESRLATHVRIGHGMVLLLQGNRVFDELSVLENLQMGGITLQATVTQQRINEVLPMFPQLKPLLNRPAYTLSGGERQMVAFARAMILKPRLLMLDEPSVGLSPKLVAEVLAKAQDIRDQLGCAVLIVEQKVEQVLSVADRVLALRMGKLEFDGTVNEARQQLKELFL